MNEYLSKIDWIGNFNNNMKLQQQYDFFKRCYDEACKKFLPEKKAKVTSNRVPWITGEVKSILKKKFTKTAVGLFERFLISLVGGSKFFLIPWPLELRLFWSNNQIIITIDFLP